MKKKRYGIWKNIYFTWWESINYWKSKI